jgi:hypothetical protein
MLDSSSFIHIVARSMIPAAPLRVCRADGPGNDVLLIPAPSIRATGIFGDGAHGKAWITIKKAGQEKPPGRKTLPSSLVYPAVRVVKDGTHGTGSPCIDGLISQFVAQGSTADLAVSCADPIHVPPFSTHTQMDQPRQKTSGND